MSALLPVPRPSDLRTLPIYVKPDWHGVTARVAGWAMQLLAWLGSKWAITVLDKFTQVISGAIYSPRAEVSASLCAHEAVHDWQARMVGSVRYTLGYALRVDRRRHYEAMAYAYETVHHGRDPENAARTAANPVYRCKWTSAEARTLIERYAAEFRTQEES